jgi:hypothetical protein
MSYAFVFRTTYVGMTARMHVFRLPEVRALYVNTRVLPDFFFLQILQQILGERRRQYATGRQGNKEI